MTALDECDKWQRNYLDRCKRIVRRYRHERTMTIAMALRSRPMPGGSLSCGATSRRWDPPSMREPSARRFTPLQGQRSYGTARLRSAQRSLTYSMDQYEFDDHIRLARDDFSFWPVATWVRYIPHAAQDETRENVTSEIEDDGPSVTTSAEIEGEVPYAEVVCDHVAYDDWGMEPCRSWDEVSYVWRRVFMSRADLIERFGKKIGKEVPLDWTPLYDTSNDSEKAEKVKRAAVYEIWEQDDRKVYWVNRSYPRDAWTFATTG